MGSFTSIESVWVLEVISVVRLQQTVKLGSLIRAGIDKGALSSDAPARERSWLFRSYFNDEYCAHQFCAHK